MIQLEPLVYKRRNCIKQQWKPAKFSSNYLASNSPWDISNPKTKYLSRHQSLEVIMENKTLENIRHKKILLNPSYASMKSFN